jgi:ribosomal protein L37AE/L43A
MSYYDDEDYDCDFAEPGGRSALRAASKTNPRNKSCPSCGRKNVLTPRDVSLGYQCGSCADAAEGGYGY